MALEIMDELPDDALVTDALVTYPWLQKWVRDHDIPESLDHRWVPPGKPGAILWDEENMVREGMNGGCLCGLCWVHLKTVPSSRHLFYDHKRCTTCVSRTLHGTPGGPTAI
jgi:hypothetical protein